MFKDRLAALLAERGLTQAQFAEQVGLRPNMVSNWLRGHEPRLTTYERLVEQFPELGRKVTVP